MKIPADFVIEQFLRTCLENFTASDFKDILDKFGIRSSINECVDYLNTNDLVFPLAGEKYITRAGAFTNQYFSFRPTRKEVDQGVFIPGDRFMPFIDPGILGSGLRFMYKGSFLTPEICEFDSNLLLDLNRLYGEEFETQIVASDPAATGINLMETDFNLPSAVNVTCCSIKPLIESGDFKNGDRLLCRVKKWSEGIVELQVQSHSPNPFQMDENDVAREMWYKTLEDGFLESFETNGPCSSIEEQIALVFARHRSELCVPCCGSVDEFLNRTRKTGFELFGVETRLWKKDEDVPAVGKWNHIVMNQVNVALESFKNVAMDPAPEYVSDSFLKDLLFSSENDLEKVIDAMYPVLYKFASSQRKCLLLNLKNRHDILQRSYNRFADFEIGALRHKTLELYATVNELVCSIDFSGVDLTVFPQQPLVILSQIFGQLNHILEVLENQPQSIVSEIDEIMLSMQGMELNYECICGELKSVLDREAKRRFSVK